MVDSNPFKGNKMSLSSVFSDKPDEKSKASNPFLSTSSVSSTGGFHGLVQLKNAIEKNENKSTKKFTSAFTNFPKDTPVLSTHDYVEEFDMLSESGSDTLSTKSSNLSPSDSLSFTENQIPSIDQKLSLRSDSSMLCSTPNAKHSTSEILFDKVETSISTLKGLSVADTGLGKSCEEGPHIESENDKCIKSQTAKNFVSHETLDDIHRTSSMPFQAPSSSAGLGGFGLAMRLAQKLQEKNNNKNSNGEIRNTSAFRDFPQAESVAYSPPFGSLSDSESCASQSFYESDEDRTTRHSSSISEFMDVLTLKANEAEIPGHVLANPDHQKTPSSTSQSLVGRHTPELSPYPESIEMSEIRKNWLNDTRSGVISDFVQLSSFDQANLHGLASDLQQSYSPSSGHFTGDALIIASENVSIKKEIFSETMLEPSTEQSLGSKWSSQITHPSVVHSANMELGEGSVEENLYNEGIQSTVFDINSINPVNSANDLDKRTAWLENFLETLSIDSSSAEPTDTKMSSTLVDEIRKRSVSQCSELRNVYPIMEQRMESMNARLEAERDKLRETLREVQRMRSRAPSLASGTQAHSVRSVNSAILTPFLDADTNSPRDNVVSSSLEKDETATKRDSTLPSSGDFMFGFTQLYLGSAHPERATTWESLTEECGRLSTRSSTKESGEGIRKKPIPKFKGFRVPTSAPVSDHSKATVSKSKLRPSESRASQTDDVDKGVNTNFLHYKDSNRKSFEESSLQNSETLPSEQISKNPNVTRKPDHSGRAAMPSLDVSSIKSSREASPDPFPPPSSHFRQQLAVKGSKIFTDKLQVEQLETRSNKPVSSLALNTTQALDSAGMSTHSREDMRSITPTSIQGKKDVIAQELYVKSDKTAPEKSTASTLLSSSKEVALSFIENTTSLSIGQQLENIDETENATPFSDVNFAAGTKKTSAIELSSHLETKGSKDSVNSFSNNLKSQASIANTGSLLEQKAETPSFSSQVLSTLLPKSKEAASGDVKASFDTETNLPQSNLFEKSSPFSFAVKSPEGKEASLTPKAFDFKVSTKSIDTEISTKTPETLMKSNEIPSVFQFDQSTSAFSSENRLESQMMSHTENVGSKPNTDINIFKENVTHGTTTSSVVEKDIPEPEDKTLNPFTNLSFGVKPPSSAPQKPEHKIPSPSPTLSATATHPTPPLRPSLPPCAPPPPPSVPENTTKMPTPSPFTTVSTTQPTGTTTTTTTHPFKSPWATQPPPPSPFSTIATTTGEQKTKTTTGETQGNEKMVSSSTTPFSFSSSSFVADSGNAKVPFSHPFAKFSSTNPQTGSNPFSSSSSSSRGISQNKGNNGGEGEEQKNLERNKNKEKNKENQTLGNPIAVEPTTAKPSESVFPTNTVLSSAPHPFGGSNPLGEMNSLGDSNSFPGGVGGWGGAKTMGSGALSSHGGFGGFGHSNTMGNSSPSSNVGFGSSSNSMGKSSTGFGARSAFSASAGFWSPAAGNATEMSTGGPAQTETAVFGSNTRFQSPNGQHERGAQGHGWGNGLSRNNGKTQEGGTNNGGRGGFPPSVPQTGFRPRSAFAGM